RISVSDRCTVGFGRSGLRDVTLGQIFHNRSGVAFGRIAVATAARSSKADAVAGFEGNVRVFARRDFPVEFAYGFPFRSAHFLDESRPVAPGFSAKDSPRLHFVAVGTLAPGDRHIRDKQGAGVAQSAAPFARSPRVGDHFAIFDAQREARFEYL